jgi:hypothetical protein
MTSSSPKSDKLQRIMEQLNGAGLVDAKSNGNNNNNVRASSESKARGGGALAVESQSGDEATSSGAAAATTVMARRDSKKKGGSHVVRSTSASLLAAAAAADAAPPAATSSENGDEQKNDNGAKNELYESINDNHTDHHPTPHSAPDDNTTTTTAATTSSTTTTTTVVTSSSSLSSSPSKVASSAPAAAAATEVWTPRYDAAFVPRGALGFYTPRDDADASEDSHRRRRRRDAGDASRSEVSEMSETVSISEVSEGGRRRRRRRRVKVSRKAKAAAAAAVVAAVTANAATSDGGAAPADDGSADAEAKRRIAVRKSADASTMDARALRKMEIAEYQRVARQREKEKQARALQDTTASAQGSPVRTNSTSKKKSIGSAPSSPAPPKPTAAAATTTAAAAAATTSVGDTASTSLSGTTGEGRNISEYVLDEAGFVQAVPLGDVRNLDLYAKEKRAMERASMLGTPESQKRKLKLSATEKAVFNDAAQLWNDDGAKAAIKLLVARDLGAPDKVARFVHARHATLDKEKLGEFFGKQDELNQESFRVFLEELSLAELDFLPALRRMIAQFRLPGEGQVIDRVMRSFCTVYCKQNPSTFEDADNAHTLAMLILTLNTATHNPNEERKIRLDDWLTYCEELTAAEGVATPAFLEAVWRDIERNEIRMPMEGLFPDMVRRGYLEQHQKGFLGGWKRRWFVLADNCLYVFATPEDENPLSVVPLNGVMAEQHEPVHKRTSLLRIYNATSPTASLQYTSKNEKGVSVPGVERFLLLAAPTDAARDTWIGDICGNAFNKAKMIPLHRASD